MKTVIVCKHCKTNTCARGDLMCGNVRQGTLELTLPEYLSGLFCREGPNVVGLFEDLNSAFKPFCFEKEET